MYSKKLAKNQRVINSVSLLIKGLLFTVQKALSLLPEGASVILNASIASNVGTPAFSIYSAAKAAVRSESPQLDTRPQRTQNPSQCD